MVELNKLLQLVVDRSCSDLHLTVGIPPTIRLHGRLRPLNSPPLTPDDTVAFMKAITPERCQTELKEKGSADFGFAYQSLARFRVGAYQQIGRAHV
jgi:twitching motility protein PilT